jgi:uncharacterized protein (DUF1697 family)
MEKNFMPDFAAFLRGINVGGHNPVPMQELKKAFESLRFKNVRTVLASGNVLFNAPGAGGAPLERKIEEKLAKTFGRDIGVLVRTVEYLQRLTEAQPFKGTAVTPQTRFYVTFLSEMPGEALRVPFTSPRGNFTILRASGREVCSVLTLTPDSRTVDMMQILDKKFGRKITTRNWQTLVRILKAFQK